MTRPASWPGAIDTMIGFPTDHRALYEAMRRQMLRDAGSQAMAMPAEYMFGDVPHRDGVPDGDPVEVTLREMDAHGVDIGLVSMSAAPEEAGRALRDHPDRFVASYTVDPNRVMDQIRELVAAHERYGLRAVSVFPHGVQPQVPIDAALMYPVYAKCVELGLPIFVTVGVAGPRVPSRCQKVELLDQVLYDFPELVVVMRHGAEPWVDHAIKLMVKWPNLHFSTSAFAPRYYSREIVEFANSRGADRILYGGYYPMGLELERIFAELPSVGFSDEVWPEFLRHNAARVLGLDGG